MSNKICFNQNAFLIAIILLTIIILVFNKYFNDCPKCESNVNRNNNINNENILISSRYPKTNNLINKLLKKRDQDSLNDPLTAPTRRLPKHIYPTDIATTQIFNEHTQGYPDNYHYIGNLIRRNDEKIVKLFGRETYPGSNKYEYYGLTSDKSGGSEIKIPVKVNRDFELYDKDEIDIDFLDTSKGKFILYMNEYDQPRYNPFIIN